MIRQKHKLFSFWVVILAFFLNGCTTSKYLNQGDKFYAGANIDIESDDKVKHRKALLSTLEQVLETEPNEKLLGSRPRVWFYQVAGDPKKNKGFRYWLKNKLGRPPVLLKHVDPDRTTQLMKNRLQNNGYFDAVTDYEIKFRENSAAVNYKVTVKNPYTIKEIHYPPEVGPLRTHIGSLKAQSLIEEGQLYNLNRLLQERQRIDKGLKNSGFYFFSPDYLLFEVDSTVGNRQVTVYLSVKGDIPYEAARRYTIDKIRIHPNYELSGDSSEISKHTLKNKGMRYVFDDQMFKRKIISNAIYFRKGSIYNADDHEATLNHLMGLGAFKFVNVRFQGDSSYNNRLNANIKITPMLKKSLRLEADLVAGSNNFLGPQLTVNFRNRNTFSGAELLKVNVRGGFETQISGQGQAVNSFEIGVETGLYVPRFISPFRIKARRGFPPHTEFEIGYNYLSRPQFFALNSFRFSYGYQWERNRKHRHQLNPMEVNLVKLIRTSMEFEQLLDQNEFLRQSYEEQFILGSNYTYHYTTIPGSSSQLFFRGNLDLSGNLLNAAQSITKGNERSRELLGEAYSQYTRLEAEWRYHYRLDRRNLLASRLLLGTGFSYGNSQVLPYVKQFFSGGSSSIRAFRARSVGPGTFEAPDSLVFTDQGGNYRFEANAEYRFDIVGIFKGALFVDAGNIWTGEDDPARPGGKFEISNFLNQLAVGSGVGLRVDASFFVLRFDLGVPLRKPFLPEGERWVIDEINPGSRSWRKENLVLNIAIGYPF